MESVAENTFSDPQKAKGRSIVSNGKAAFLPGSATALRKARRYRDILAELIADLGGNSILSEAQRQLCRRAATLALQCEHWDAAAADGAAVDWDLYSRTSGHLRRIFETLGIERKQRDVSTSAVLEHFRRPPHRRAP
jgi:hypothetical protein